MKARVAFYSCYLLFLTILLAFNPYTWLFANLKRPTLNRNKCTGRLELVEKGRHELNVIYETDCLSELRMRM